MVNRGRERNLRRTRSRQRGNVNFVPQGGRKSVPEEGTKKQNSRIMGRDRGIPKTCERKTGSMRWANFVNRQD